MYSTGCRFLFRVVTAHCPCMVDAAEGTDGIPSSEYALMSAHAVGGDDGRKGEEGVGVPLIPDRPASRAHSARWPGGRTDAFETRRLGVIAIAALSVGALVVAAALGAIPLAGAAAVALLVPAAIVDVEERRLPDVWVIAALGALPVALALDLAFGASTHTDPTLGGILGGAAAMALPVLALHLVSPASMGFGDVKVAAVLGAAVGTVDWRLGALALCVAAASGAVAGLLARQRTIAFGPFLVFGAWLSLLAHESVADVIFSGGVAS